MFRRLCTLIIYNCNGVARVYAKPLKRNQRWKYPSKTRRQSSFFMMNVTAGLIQTSLTHCLRESIPYEVSIVMLFSLALKWHSLLRQQPGWMKTSLNRIQYLLFNFLLPLFEKKCSIYKLQLRQLIENVF